MSKKQSENRWTVLIVDDEFRIGQLIRKLIQWDRSDLICLGVVYDGESALHILLEQEPDIVITDIQMPKISGLELIRRAKESGIKSRFIVVSGYAEFEYAHQAMQYGVENYLLKPINKEELNQALSRIRIELFQTVRTEEKISLSERILRKDYLNNILDPNTAENIPIKNIALTGELYRGINIKLDYLNYEDRNVEQDNRIMERVQTLTEKIFEGHVREILMTRKEALNQFVLLNYDGAMRREVKNDIGRIITGIKDVIIGYDQYDVTIGIGLEKEVFSDIRFSILEARRAVAERIILGSGRLIYSGEEGDDLTSSEVTERYRSLMRTACAGRDREAVFKVVEVVFSDQLSDLRSSGARLYDNAKLLLDTFFQEYGLTHKEERDSLAQALERLQHCQTPEALKRCVQEELEYVFNELRNDAERELTKPVRQAVQYVEAHYADKIVLEDIAELAGLNPAYFSVLFKKEIGENFSTWLLELRMEKAKALLVQTDETIAAVGEKVGYRDYRYFSQNFARVVGIKPSVYRKLYS